MAEFKNDPETCPHDDWEHEGETHCTFCGKDMRAYPRLAEEPRCADCGEYGVLTGHMECQYPKDRP